MSSMLRPDEVADRAEAGRDAVVASLALGEARLAV